MTRSRSRFVVVAALLVTVLVGGCEGSEPVATDSPEPTPSSSTTPPPLPVFGWRDGRYPVPCLPRAPTVRFEDGKATYRDFQLTAQVVARGELAHHESVSIHVVCIGASWFPSSVLVFIGALDGAEYVGLALSPDELIDLKRARYVDQELELTGFGFTRRAPLCCPDLRVTKTVALKDGELVKTALTKGPYTR
jgi:hypothetical protein